MTRHQQPGPNDPVDNAEVKAALARVQRDADRGVSAHAIKDQFTERLLRTLDALQNSTDRWRLGGTWLVEDLGRCTCSGPSLGVSAHESYCGLEPIMDLSRVPGWEQMIKDQARLETLRILDEIVRNLPSPNATGIVKGIRARVQSEGS